MEKTLVKTGLYSLAISFLILFAGVNRVKSTTDVNGMTSAMEIPYPDFFFMISRYSIIISFIIVISVFAIMQYKKYKRKKSS
ncbi:hypothetical protein ABFG93_00500 [Pseudalkalibacillus hwajinpoensis]|uniref:hypothetical protein n=1 Tax=Guptibacillus hwajinpoensis TaxID=208199 RepID=UPI00325A65D2